MKANNGSYHTVDVEACKASIKVDIQTRGSMQCENLAPSWPSQTSFYSTVLNKEVKV